MSVLRQKNLKFRTLKFFVLLLSSCEQVLLYSQDRMAKKKATSTSSAIAMAWGLSEALARRIMSLSTEMGMAFFMLFGWVLVFVSAEKLTEPEANLAV
jgi:hypothetical protein